MQLEALGISAGYMAVVKVIWNLSPLKRVENIAMEKPKRRTLLPGVSDSGTAPEIAFHSRRVVISARRRAALRDVFDLLLLACVDGLFLRWPHAHIPTLDRVDTLAILAIINALLIANVWSARLLPRWRARRLAATWSNSERNRFVRF